MTSLLLYTIRIRPQKKNHAHFANNTHIFFHYNTLLYEVQQWQRWADFKLLRDPTYLAHGTELWCVSHLTIWPCYNRTTPYFNFRVSGHFSLWISFSTYQSPIGSNLSQFHFTWEENSHDLCESKYVHDAMQYGVLMMPIPQLKSTNGCHFNLQIIFITQLHGIRILAFVTVPGNESDRQTSV